MHRAHFPAPFELIHSTSFTLLLKHEQVSIGNRSTSTMAHPLPKFAFVVSQVELAKRNPFTGAPVLGKISGPDNKPFFFVDGPHGAPSQHVFNYETSVLIGAGIGVT
eukprot:6208494-Pleurochrysis_carterae.AAC.3